MLNLSATPTPLPRILLLTLLLIDAAGAQTISDTVKRTNSHGDRGYWQNGQPDVMILWPEDDGNVVRRFTGNARHPYPYRLWVDSDRVGGFPVPLKDESTFNNFLEHIKANDDKDWCQVAETWSDWTGSPPSACGVHGYTQRQTCTVALDADKPCPDLCKPAVRTRNRQVDNGRCRAESPSAPSSSRPSSSPSSPLSSRPSSPSSSRPSSRPSSSSTPPSSPPSRPPGTCSTSAWSPSTGTVCAGESLTQTRTLADCSTGRRTAGGTKSCRPSCRATSWSPAAGTVCSGKSFSQTRKLANCSNQTRTARGTKTCAPRCSYRCAMQTTGALMGTLWILYRKCTGDAYGSPAGTYATAAACNANRP